MADLTAVSLRLGDIDPSHAGVLRKRHEGFGLDPPVPCPSRRAIDRSRCMTRGTAAALLVALVASAGCIGQSEVPEQEPTWTACGRSFFDGIYLDCDASIGAQPVADAPPSDWTCESSRFPLSLWSSPQGDMLGVWFTAYDSWHDSGRTNMFGDLIVSFNDRSQRVRFMGGLDVFVSVDGMPARGSDTTVSLYLQTFGVPVPPMNLTFEDAEILDVPVADGHLPVIRFERDGVFEMAALFRDRHDDYTAYVFVDTKYLDADGTLLAQLVGGQWNGKFSLFFPQAPLLDIFDSRCS